MKRIYQVISTCVMCLLMAAGAHAYDITLAWDPSAEMNIEGYNLYARVDNSEYNLVYTLTLDEVDPANPQFVVMDLEKEVAYDFVVTALDSDGLESDFSNEVSVLNSEVISDIVINDTVGVVNDQIHAEGGSGGGGCFISAAGHMF
jgi:Fibronectin type III domain